MGGTLGELSFRRIDGESWLVKAGEKIAGPFSDKPKSRDWEKAFAVVEYHESQMNARQKKLWKRIMELTPNWQQKEPWMLAGLAQLLRQNGESEVVVKAVEYMKGSQP